MSKITDARNFAKKKHAGQLRKNGKTTTFSHLKDVVKNWFLVLRCSTLGCLVGALPGLGGTVVDWIAYSHLKQTTKDTSQFGKGDIRGVIAPESANNAKEGGALIPTLIFGIPGSGNKVLLLGGFVLIGIEPGLDMVTTNLDLTYLMIWSLATVSYTHLTLPTKA